MATHANNDPPLRGPTITVLLETAAKYPTFLLERLLTTRILFQALFPSPCPLLMKIGKDDSGGAVAPMNLSITPWLSDDPVSHGFLTQVDNDLKVVFPGKWGVPTIKSVATMSDFSAAHPATWSPAEWWNLDLHSSAYRGRPVVTIYDPGQAVPAEWVSAVDYAVTRFSLQLATAYESIHCCGEGRALAPAAFHDSLRGLPRRFVECMLTLADEIANLAYHLTENIRDNEPDWRGGDDSWNDISEACIAAMVPGLKALALHGFGWPGLMDPMEAKTFLFMVRREEPVSLSRIGRLHKGLHAEARDELLGYLLKSGIVSMEGRLVSVFEPEQLLEHQLYGFPRDEGDLSSMARQA